MKLTSRRRFCIIFRLPLFSFCLICYSILPSLHHAFLSTWIKNKITFNMDPILFSHASFKISPWKQTKQSYSRRTRTRPYYKERYEVDSSLGRWRWWWSTSITDVGRNAKRWSHVHFRCGGKHVWKVDLKTWGIMTISLCEPRKRIKMFVYDVVEGVQFTKVADVS